MPADSQLYGLRWGKNLESLIDLYRKQIPVLGNLKLKLKEIDGELEHEIAVLEDIIEDKLEKLLLHRESIGNTLSAMGSFALTELEENIACLTILLDVLKAGGNDIERAEKSICVRQGLKRVAYSLDQLLLFVSDPFKNLTSREQEILVYLSEGFSNEEIADKLYISIKTVKNHVSSIYRKTGYRERAKLVIAARNILE